VPEIEPLDVKLRSLGFQGQDAMRLVVGTVTITGGLSLRGFSLMFTEIGPRSALQYETHGPVSASAEIIAGLIRSNLALNHSSSVGEWDLLQHNLEQARRANEL
jgi:hypothetical protein